MKYTSRSLGTMLGYLDFMVLSKHIMEIFPDEDNITADIYRYFNFHPTKVVEIYNFIYGYMPHKMKGLTK